MGGIAAIAAPIAGSVIGGLMGGSGAPSAPNVNVYQPTGTGTADTQLQNLNTQAYNNVYGANNPYTQYSPQFAQIFNQLYNNPYAGGYQAGANTAGTAYTGAGTQQSGAASNLINSILSGLPQAQNVANIGLDPQKVLYAQQLQQAQDQANVGNAQYGLTGQQAAGNLNQATQNFNTNWENQQLNRAISGLNALGQYNQAAGAGLTQGTNVGTTGAQNLYTGAQTPYATSTGITGAQNTALNNYIQSLLGPSTSTQQAVANLGDYLGQGIGASSAGANAALNDYYAQLQGAGGGALAGYMGGQMLGGLFNPSSPTPASSGSALPWQMPLAYQNSAAQSYYGG